LRAAHFAYNESLEIRCSFAPHLGLEGELPADHLETKLNNFDEDQKERMLVIVRSKRAGHCNYHSLGVPHSGLLQRIAYLLGAHAGNYTRKDKDSASPKKRSAQKLKREKKDRWGSKAVNMHTQPIAEVLTKIRILLNRRGKKFAKS